MQGVMYLQYLADELEKFPFFLLKDEIRIVFVLEGWDLRTIIRYTAELVYRLVSNPSAE